MNGFCGIVYRNNDSNLVHVPLEESVISVAIVDVSARVTITQVYRNESESTTPRCKYVFPVPARAAVCAFSMIREDKKLIYGVAKEKSRAAEDYEAGILAGKFSGLVEWVSDDVFTISLGSIPAKQAVTTRIMFVMDLMNDELSDKVRLQLPLCLGERYGPTPTGLVDATTITDSVKVKITVEVQTSGAVLSVTSPSHEIQLKRYNTHYGRPSRRRMIAKFRSKTFLDRDFVLVVQADGLDAPRCFMEHDIARNTVALQLTLIPKFDLPPIPRQEYIFLVDQSGSMNNDERIDVAKESLSMLIRCLPSENTLFNIFSFGTGCTSLWQHSVSYDGNRLQEAVHYIDGMAADMGGTEIRGAFENVFASRNRTVPTAVFVLTDGEVTEEGPVREVVAAAISSALSAASIRLFVLGIGLQTSTAVCESLARAGNGECLMAMSTESILGKCTSLLRAGRISTIKDVSINWGVVSSRDSGVGLNGPDVVQQSPATIEHLYPHSRSVVFAILGTKHAPKEVVVRGKTDNGEVVELNVKVESVKFGIDSSSPPFVHSLAAKRLIRDLEEDESKAKLPEAAWKREIVRLGEHYQLASSHTSFVAVDYGKAIPSNARPRRKRRPGLRDDPDDFNSGPMAVLQTVWTYLSNPFVLFGSRSTNFMTQPNPSAPGGWPSTSESSSSQLGINESLDHEGRYDSVSTFSTMSSLEGQSSSEPGDEQRGRRSRIRPRPRPQSGRSPSPQIHPTREAVAGRNAPRTSTFTQSTPPPRRIPSNVSELVQLMSCEGSFPLSSPLMDIVGVSTVERARALHPDETLCATALAIAFLEKNLANQRELLTALVDKSMEFMRGRSNSDESRRMLMRARELVI